MAFFKPSTSTASSKSIERLHMLIWTLIYAGLLTLVLGLAVERIDDDLGWSMVVGGVILAGAGSVLIYARSRMSQR